MPPEDLIHERFSAELDARRPPLGDLVAQALSEGRRRKRRARIGAGAMSAAGVLAIAAAVTQLPGSATAHRVDAGSSPTSPRLAATTPAPSSASSSATTPAPSPTTTTSSRLPSTVKHVDPGTVTLEKGFYLNYTTSSMSWWEYEGGLTVQYKGSNTWGSDFATLSQGDRLVTGFYVGDKDVETAAFTIDGKRHPAVVVKVNGANGWCGVYYLRPPGQTGWNSITLDVYDAGGNVIASSSIGEVGPPPTSPSAWKGTDRILPVESIPINSPFPGATPTAPPAGTK